MLKQAKRLALRTAQTLGVSSLWLNSSWRRERLLILCYHGVAIRDEHLWNPSLFVTAEFLNRRFELLRDSQANVLPLGEALQKLTSGALPSRSVAITFDDGNYDFYARAYPVLERYGWPVTVYLTTYYSGFNRPVFDPACSYLLWKASGQNLTWPEAGLDRILLDEPGILAAAGKIRQYAIRQKLSGQQKDDLLVSLAARLSVDWAPVLDNRLFHIMTPSEAAELAAKGLVDFQLHTHRHRVSTQRERFSREIEDNRRYLSEIAPGPFTHFCYPGGFHLPEFEEWLPQFGVRSATTCEVALATQATHPMLIPRLVDQGNLSEVEFSAWISGLAQFLPQRQRYQPAPGQLMEEQVP